MHYVRTAGANASSYRVYRNGQVVAETDQTSIVDSGLLASTGYTYYVVSVNGSYTSDPSVSVLVTTTKAPPSPPRDFKAMILQ